jgi:hypothetical protein
MRNSVSVRTTFLARGHEKNSPEPCRLISNGHSAHWSKGVVMKLMVLAGLLAMWFGYTAPRETVLLFTYPAWNGVAGSARLVGGYINGAWTADEDSKNAAGNKHRVQWVSVTAVSSGSDLRWTAEPNGCASGVHARVAETFVTNTAAPLGVSPTNRLRLASVKPELDDRELRSLAAALAWPFDRSEQLRVAQQLVIDFDGDGRHDSLYLLERRTSNRTRVTGFDQAVLLHRSGTLPTVVFQREALIGERDADVKLRIAGVFDLDRDNIAEVLVTERGSTFDAATVLVWDGRRYQPVLSTGCALN